MLSARSALNEQKKRTSRALKKEDETNNNFREFVKTHVILAPLREFSRSRAASKIPFPGAQAGEFHVLLF